MTPESGECKNRSRLEKKKRKKENVFFCGYVFFYGSRWHLAEACAFIKMVSRTTRRHFHVQEDI
jgi:hypothetical protein